MLIPKSLGYHLPSDQKAAETSIALKSYLEDFCASSNGSNRDRQWHQRGRGQVALEAHCVKVKLFACVRFPPHLVSLPFFTAAEVFAFRTDMSDHPPASSSDAFKISRGSLFTEGIEPNLIYKCASPSEALRMFFQTLAKSATKISWPVWRSCRLFL